MTFERGCHLDLPQRADAHFCSHRLAEVVNHEPMPTATPISGTDLRPCARHVRSPARGGAARPKGACTSKGVCWVCVLRAAARGDRMSEGGSWNGSPSLTMSALRCIVRSRHVYISNFWSGPTTIHLGIPMRLLPWVLQSHIQGHQQPQSPTSQDQVVATSRHVQVVCSRQEVKFSTLKSPVRSPGAGRVTPLD